MRHLRLQAIRLAAVALLAASACAPAAPSPTVAPPKPTAAPATPAPTPAPAKPTEAPKPAPKPTEAPAAKPAEKPAFDEQAVADFYRGKTVKILVGLAAGGGYDQLARMLARQLPKHIPGNPTVIVENRVGAGSLVAANAVFNTEPKDGTVIGNFNENLVLLQAVGAPGVEFDAARFQWIGSLEKGQPACVIRRDRGVDSVQDLIAGKPLALGAQAPGSYGYHVPKALQLTLAPNIRIVPGYAGTAPMRLAIESGEIDGGCWTWSDMRKEVQPWLDASPPFARILLIMGDRVPDDPYLKETPAIETLARTDEQRLILRAVNAPTAMTKPYAVAPGVPRDRVEALRQAFARATSDPDFKADFQKAGFDVRPSTGAEVEQVANGLLRLPPPILEKVKQVSQ